MVFFGPEFSVDFFELFDELDWCVVGAESFCVSVPEFDGSVCAEFYHTSAVVVLKLCDPSEFGVDLGLVAWDCCCGAWRVDVRRFVGCNGQFGSFLALNTFGIILLPLFCYNGVCCGQIAKNCCVSSGGEGF